MLALLLSTIAAVEIAFRLPLLGAFRNLARISARTPRVWAYRRGLEERKERATRLLSVQMFGYSIRAMWMIALVASPIGLVLVVDPWMALGARESLMNWKDALVETVVSLAYALARIQISRLLQRP